MPIEALTLIVVVDALHEEEPVHWAEFVTPNRIEGTLPQSSASTEKEAKAQADQKAQETFSPQSAIDLGGLEFRLGYLLRRAQVWIFRDIIALMSRLDIRPAQFSVLTVIGANPGITQRSLGQALSIEPGRLVLMLDELERRGLAKREPAPNDRRSRLLFLTPEGQAQLRQLTALADEHEAHTLAKLGAGEKAHLLEVLQTFLRE